MPSSIPTVYDWQRIESKTYIFSAQEIDYASVGLEFSFWEYGRHVKKHLLRMLDKIFILKNFIMHRWVEFNISMNQWSEIQ